MTLCCGAFPYLLTHWFCCVMHCNDTGNIEFKEAKDHVVAGSVERAASLLGVDEASLKKVLRCVYAHI